MLIWVRKHVKDPWITEYTEDLTGPQDTATIEGHGAMLKEARDELQASGSLVQKSLAEALRSLTTENPKWNLKGKAATDWSQSRSKMYRSMLRHLDQAILKAAVHKTNPPPWVLAVLQDENEDEEHEEEEAASENLADENQEYNFGYDEHLQASSLYRG